MKLPDPFYTGSNFYDETHAGGRSGLVLAVLVINGLSPDDSNTKNKLN